MNYIDREYDIIQNNTESLEHLQTLKDFPVFMGCVDHSEQEDIKADMSWWISPATGVIQLNPLLPLDVVYAAEHGSGTVGAIWDQHHQAFADFIAKYNISTILEIGGLHGYLAEKCLRHNPKLDWTIVEPNPCVNPSIKAKVIQGFFDNKFETGIKYDAIVHSHVLEHLYNPHEFMSHTAAFMDAGSLLFISIPNMKSMLEKMYTNCLNFEHTYYINDDYLIYLLECYGFELLAKCEYKEDHSNFYCAKKLDSIKHNIKLPQLYTENKNLFLNYIEYHTRLVSELNKAIADLNNVYLFGGHIFSQYLIAFGLDTTNIICILDNDGKKQGKRLYGTNLIVKSPDILKELPKATIILRAGVYNNEIKSQIDNINSEITYI